MTARQGVPLPCPAPRPRRLAPRRERAGPPTCVGSPRRGARCGGQQTRPRIAPRGIQEYASPQGAGAVGRCPTRRGGRAVPGTAGLPCVARPCPSLPSEAVGRPSLWEWLPPHVPAPGTPSGLPVSNIRVRHKPHPRNRDAKPKSLGRVRLGWVGLGWVRRPTPAVRSYSTPGGRHTKFHKNKIINGHQGKRTPAQSKDHHGPW